MPDDTKSHPSPPSASNGSGSEPTPRGFENASNDSASAKCPGRNPRPTTPRSAAAPRIQRSFRQRRDGSRPSGNSRSASPRSANISGDTASPSETATLPPGSESGRTSNEYSAYSAAPTRTETTTPIARKTQPISLPGRRQMTNAPTVANAVTATKYTAAVTASAADGVSLNPEWPGSTPTLSIDSANVTPASAMQTTHTDQPSLEAARALIASPPAPAATARRGPAASFPRRRRAARRSGCRARPGRAAAPRSARACAAASYLRR